MEFRLIEFGSRHYEAACALRQAVLRKPLGLSLSTDDLRGESEQLHFGLFADNGDLVACVVAVPQSARSARIRQTAVLPAFQGRGRGRQLMYALEGDLAARGFANVSLHARTSAVGFYEKLGYQVIGEEFVEVSVPHRRMVKRLRR